MPVKKDPAKRTKNGTGAYKSKVEYIKDKNAEVYDRIIFSVPKGYKQKLQDYMQERINEIEQLESIAERTEEQEQLRLFMANLSVREYTASQKYKF